MNTPNKLLLHKFVLAVCLVPPPLLTPLAQLVTLVGLLTRQGLRWTLRRKDPCGSYVRSAGLRTHLSARCPCL